MTARDRLTICNRGDRALRAAGRYRPPFSGATAGHEAAPLFTRTLAHGVATPRERVGTQPPL